MGSDNGGETLGSVHFVADGANFARRLQQAVRALHEVTRPVFPVVVDDARRFIVHCIPVLVLNLQDYTKYYYRNYLNKTKDYVLILHSYGTRLH